MILLKLKGLSLWAYAPILFLGAGQCLLQGWILFFLAHDAHPSYRVRDEIQNAFICAFFNGITPVGGGQASQTYAFRSFHFSYSEIAALLWKDFFFYQCALLLVAGMLLLGSMHTASHLFTQALFGVKLGYIINFLVVVFLWTMHHFPQIYLRLATIVISFFSHLHLVKNPSSWIDKATIMIEEFHQQTSTMKKNPLQSSLLLFINMMRIFLSYSLPFFIAKLLRLPVDFSIYIQITVFTSYVHMLNALTPLPGDAGWSESMFLILYMSMFSKSDAGSMMILWRFASFYFNMLVGSVVFMLMNKKNARKKSKIHHDMAYENHLKV